MTSLSEKQQNKLQSTQEEQSCLPLIVDVWGLDEQARKGVFRANNINRMKHGLLAQVPIVCYRDSCPYIATCYLKPEERPEKGRCPIEVSAIINLFERYCDQLDVDEEDVVDLTLIKELIDIDVQLMRADHYMSSNPSFVEEIPVFMTENGYIAKKPELVKAVEYKDRLRRERHRILQLLNSTRKDRGEGKKGADPSVLAAEVLAKAQEMGLELHTVVDITDFSQTNQGKDDQ